MPKETIKIEGTLNPTDIAFHTLRIFPNFYQDIMDGIKSFEVRKNDRRYRVGDVLILQEYYEQKNGGEFTGRIIEKFILYRLDGDDFEGIEKGYCVLGLGAVPRWE